MPALGGHIQTTMNTVGARGSGPTISETVPAVSRLDNETRNEERSPSTFLNERDAPDAAPWL